MIDIKVITQAIYYLLKNIGKCDELKIVKLIYLTDKYHLLKYARTVTNDSYFAMRMGPVGSTVKDVLCFNRTALSKQELKFINIFIKQDGEYDYQINEKASDNELDMLSETDFEALNFVIKQFGSWTKSQLIRYTHNYPEWKQYENLLKQKTLRGEIKTEEIMTTIDDIFPVTKENIEISRETVSGQLQ